MYSEFIYLFNDASIYEAIIPIFRKNKNLIKKFKKNHVQTNDTYREKWSHYLESVVN